LTYSSYWPVDSFEFGVPFVHLKGYYPPTSDHNANGLNGLNGAHGLNHFSKNKLI
jgi:hypothetical protein